MSIWGKPEDTVYQTGIDRGVLYLPDGSAVPWNGLISVKHQPQVKNIPAYFGGEKVHDIPQPSAFVGEISAFTYPDEIKDMVDYSPGTTLERQAPKVYNFSWREKLSDGNYLINVLGNITLKTPNMMYDTVKNQPAPHKHIWTIQAPRVKIPNTPPAAWLVVDTRTVGSTFLTYFTNMLYGTDGQEAGFTSFEQLLIDVVNYYSISITDNGDGTWTADTDQPGDITGPDGSGVFTVSNADVTWISEPNEYLIGDV